MGLFDFFKHKVAGQGFAIFPQVGDDGLLLNFKDGVAITDMDSLLEVGTQASAEEKILRAYLSDLLVEAKCQVQPQGVLIPWATFYHLHGDAAHHGLMSLFRTPAMTSAVPVLVNTASLADDTFRVTISGWVLNGRKADVTAGIGPQVFVDGTPFLVSREVFGLLSSLRDLFPHPPRLDTQHAREAAWGLVRAKAVSAGAILGTPYLATTIILTPEVLWFASQRTETPFGRVYEVKPTFDGAPEGWLEAFDGLRSVQEHYDITRGGGRTRITLTEPVRRVLEVVKREMPNRQVTGKKAERFLHNPRAYLGDLAEGVIADTEETDVSGGLPNTTFFLQPLVESGRIVTADLVVNEFYGDGFSQSFRSAIESSQELRKLTARIGDALADERLAVSYLEFDLTLDANAEVELERMLGVLRTWECQSDAFIRLEDIYELSDYAERIEGIGVAKPVYVPALQKEKADDEDGNGWLPQDLTPILKVVLPGSGDPVLVPLTQEWVDGYEKKVTEAEKSGAQTVADAAIPTDLDTSQARVLVDGFKTLLGAKDNPPGSGPEKKHVDGQQASTGKGKRETLLVKTNLLGVDYVETRKASLTPPEYVQPRMPSTLRSGINVRSHQAYGIAWFQHLYEKSPQEVRGCLLADDMGLGKTLQLLNVLGRIYEDDPKAPPSLVLVPKSLLQNWAGEVEKFFTPDYPRHLVLYGEELNRRKQPKTLIEDELRTKGITDLLVPGWVGSNKLVITTYDVLTGYEFSFARENFTFVICDEAQRIKNPAANVSIAVRKLKARFRVACTGTPVENSLVDLWCLFDFFQPGLLGSLEQFAQTYRKPIECKSDEEAQALKRLQALIKPQTLRRTKKDIAHEMTTKYFAVTGDSLKQRILKTSLGFNDLLKVEITDHQRVLYMGGLRRLQYARQEKDGKQRGQLSFDALHFMKAVCAEPYCLPGRKFVPDPGGIAVHLRNSPKLDWMLRELETIKHKGEKAIVFTEIREVQSALHYFLRETFDLKPFIVNGESENRQSYIDKFSAKPGFDVIILSPLAAGAGLNVVAANHVFHFTRAWNPAKENQATDRSYRIGQERDVIVYCPTVVDTADSLYSTFEERLDVLLKEKAALAKTTIDGDELSEMLNGSAGDVKFTEFMTGAATGSATAPRRLTLDDVDRLDGNAFEHFCALLLSRQGYLAQVTEKRQGDGGIDVLALRASDGVLAQCKSSTQASIGWDAIKEVVGGAASYQSRHPGTRFKKMAITNQRFNSVAREQATANQVELFERGDIGALIQSSAMTDLELEEFMLGAKPRR